MKVLKTPYGRTLVRASLNTMEIGESWSLDASCYSVGSLRVACSNVGTKGNKSFTVNAPVLSSDDKIKITRTR